MDNTYSHGHDGKLWESEGQEGLVCAAICERKGSDDSLVSEQQTYFPSFPSELPSYSCSAKTFNLLHEYRTRALQIKQCWECVCVLGVCLGGGITIFMHP